MIRLLRLTRKLPIYRQQITFNLHTLKSSELDEPAYHKQPLDPTILSIVKKYEADIFYSSHIELNKKPLSYEQRKALMVRLRRKKEEEPPTSILVEKLAEEKKTEQQEQHQQGTETIEEAADSTEYDDVLSVRHEEQRLQLARSKLKILTEIGLRRSALDYELQDYPDNWMEDYDTYDEREALADTQYGTPGKQYNITLTTDDNTIEYRFPCIYRSKNTNLKGAMPRMWVVITMCRHQFARLFAQWIDA